jgi:hypothetical protein
MMMCLKDLMRRLPCGSGFAIPSERRAHIKLHLCARDALYGTNVPTAAFTWEVSDAFTLPSGLKSHRNFIISVGSPENERTATTDKQ